jgi:hypothetical protein
MSAAAAAITKKRPLEAGNDDDEQQPPPPKMVRLAFDSPKHEKLALELKVQMELYEQLSGARIWTTTVSIVNPPKSVSWEFPRYSISHHLARLLTVGIRLPIGGPKTFEKVGKWRDMDAILKTLALLLDECKRLDPAVTQDTCHDIDVLLTEIAAELAACARRTEKIPQAALLSYQDRYNAFMTYTHREGFVVLELIPKDHQLLLL